MRMAPPQTARQPNPRHGLATFAASSRIREENSIILPEVDVQADMDAINQGEGMYDASKRQVWVNSRLYGMHEDGTTYPMHGEGIVRASRGVYNALKIIRR